MKKQPLNLEDLLGTGLSVFVGITPAASEEIVVPEHLLEQEMFTLELGYNLPVPIPDLEITEHGFSCTLSFNRTPQYCYIPWQCVLGFVGDAVTEWINNNTPEDINQDLGENNKPTPEAKKPSIVSDNGNVSSINSKTKKDKDGKIIRPDWLKVIK